MEMRIATKRERFREVLGGRPRSRILLEASTENEWVARVLEELGHDVIVAPFAAIGSHRFRSVSREPLGTGGSGDRFPVPRP